MENLEKNEIEFSCWLENCVNDAREKLHLSWLIIAIQLQGKAQKALLNEFWLGVKGNK